ncbi:SET domain-containing protein [Hypoxylon sp. FL1284]|nr:SET domain-containing protein [Hypoxylon sp. FL1284]
MRFAKSNVILVSFASLAEAGALAGICPWSPAQKIKQVCANPHFIKPAPPSDSIHEKTLSDWKGPEHCVNNTCIYSNERIGDGLVLLTTEQNADTVKNFPPPSQTQAKETIYPFHAEEIPGKGMGIIADRKIPKGETIFIRTPVLMVQADAHITLERGARDALYDLAVQKLPDKGQELFMGQMGKDPYTKIEVNCFQFFIRGADKTGGHIGCYPEVAKMNHDCRPNVHYRINNMTHTSTAVRDIAAGEELSISYVEVMQPRAERRALLRHGWGFECGCAQCTARDADSPDSKPGAASDARLARIAELERALENFNETVVAADTGAQIAALYERERLDVFVGRAYTRAALNYALFGDAGRAREYARRAAEALGREYGPDSADARAMRVLAEDPRRHWTWGRRRKGQKGAEEMGKGE